MSDDVVSDVSSDDSQESLREIKYLSPATRESYNKQRINIAPKRQTVKNILTQRQAKKINGNFSDSLKGIRKINNGKRLKFKDTQEEDTISNTVTSDEGVAGMHSLGKSEKQRVNINRPKVTVDHNKQKTRSRNEREIFEGERSVNGYRFVYKSKDEIPDSKEENKKANSGKRFSHIYNEPDDDFKNESDKNMKNDISSFKPTEDDPDYTYEMYLEFWNKAKGNFNELKFDQILFPNRTGNVEILNLENLKSFILSAGSHSYLKNIKLERIRWHPDSMIRLLKQMLILNSISDDEMQSVITKTFQMINELWEQNDK
ncbi:hypothetical protein B5S32_g920 [[Candida] boidinii]|nr:hypothetical protein B5S32_g920 [[Candida] boidinii]